MFIFSLSVGSTMQSARKAFAIAAASLGVAGMSTEASAQEPFMTTQCRGGQCSPAFGVPVNRSEYVYVGGRSGFTGNIAIVNSFNRINNGGVYVEGNNSGTIYHRSPVITNSPGAVNIDNSYNSSFVEVPSYAVRQYVGPARPVYRHPIRISPIENPHRYHIQEEPIYSEPQSVAQPRARYSQAQPVRSSEPVVVDHYFDRGLGTTVTVTERDLTPGEMAQFEKFGRVIKFEK